MKLLAPNFKPVGEVASATYSNTLATLIVDSDSIEIVTGYFSVESITEFQAILILNPKKRQVIFTVGMAAFDGLTATQLNALLELNSYLVRSGAGEVTVAVTFPVHSKISKFNSENFGCVAMVGSSNFTNLVSSQRQFETDLLLENYEPGLAEVNGLLLRLREATLPLTQSLERITINKASLIRLATESGVERNDGLILPDQLGKFEFNLPIKPEGKSHLNVFFGKGRRDHKGRVIPRPWYEVELIIGKAITTQPGYPAPANGVHEFQVVTDDGWKFKCKSTGQNGKNFRSSGNLEILGKWLKGRLEETGALKPGEIVTEKTLALYGRSDLTLTNVAGAPDTWYLDFSN
jgi:hypothetical protein